MSQDPNPLQPGTDRDGVGVVVLGMHRSGTSLASHLFGVLGCSHGGELMPAKEDNAGGFWEHEEIVNVHDEFLAEMGRGWADPRPWTEDDFETTAARKARERLAEIFSRNFQRSRLWVLKDPRHCRLLPLWRPIFGTCVHRIAFFHMIRNPLSIARSLEARNGFPTNSSLLLWLRHVVEAERFTRGHPRAWVAFENLAEQPAESIRAACTRMGIEQHFDFRRTHEAVANSVARDRIHHRSRNEDSSAWSWVAQTRRALLGLVSRESEELHAALDQVAAEMRSADAAPHLSASVELLGSFASQHFDRCRDLEAEVQQAKRHLVKVETEVADAANYVAKLEAELSEARTYLTKLESELSGAAKYQTELEKEIADKTAYEQELSAYARKLETLLSSKP